MRHRPGAGAHRLFVCPDIRAPPYRLSGALIADKERCGVDSYRVLPQSVADSAAAAPCEGMDAKFPSQTDYANGLRATDYA
jgi:hypothetical protein